MVFLKGTGRASGLCFWLIGATLAPLPAMADEVCQEMPLILGYASEILDGRDLVSRFEKRRIGAEAVYLTIHYAGLSDDAALALIDSLLTETHADAAEMRSSFLIARDGIDAGLAGIDPDPVRALAMSGLSVRRAVMLADAGKTYFRLLQEARLDPEFEEFVAPRMFAPRDLAIFTADQPDEVITAMAKAAEVEGLFVPAIFLAAEMTDLTLYEALMSRHGNAPEVMALTSTPWLQNYGGTLRHGTGPVPRVDPAAPATQHESDARYYDGMRATYIDGPMNFSLTLFNQTFWEAEWQIVQKAFSERVLSGDIDPVADPEAAWLFQYRAWAKAVGRDEVQATLSTFDFPTARLRHYAETAAESLDWMLASEALVPVVSGEVAAVPGRPALLTDAFDWELWTGVAVALASGPAGTFDGPVGPVAAELLAGARRWAEMEQVIAGFEPFDRLVFLRDIMQRLDRGCAGYMAQPGQALLLGGDFLYRF